MFYVVCCRSGFFASFPRLNVKFSVHLVCRRQARKRYIKFKIDSEPNKVDDNYLWFVCRSPKFAINRTIRLYNRLNFEIKSRKKTAILRFRLVFSTIIIEVFNLFLVDLIWYCSGFFLVRNVFCCKRRAFANNRGERIEFILPCKL